MLNAPPLYIKKPSSNSMYSKIPPSDSRSMALHSMYFTTTPPSDSGSMALLSLFVQIVQQLHLTLGQWPFCHFTLQHLHLTMGPWPFCHAIYFTTPPSAIG